MANFRDISILKNTLFKIKNFRLFHDIMFNLAKQQTLLKLYIRYFLV